MSQRSREAAALRPSAIAQATRLWPLAMSPHAKTPSALVAQLPSTAVLPRAFRATPS